MYFHLLFYLSLFLPLSFLLCCPVLPHLTTMFPYLLFVSQLLHRSNCPSQHSFSCFFAFPLFCSTYQIAHHASQNSGHLLSKRSLTTCLIHFPPSYLWFYFHCFSLFHHENHFAYHHTVLLCNALIHHYPTIAHILQGPPYLHIT